MKYITINFSSDSFNKYTLIASTHQINVHTPQERGHMLLHKINEIDLFRKEIKIASKIKNQVSKFYQITNLNNQL